jgi:AcrR family transcriptional regulator
MTGVRKPQILEHLYTVIASEGLEGASLAKVADHMGVYPSMLIHYFKTKEKMMIEFVDFVFEKFLTYYLTQTKTISTDEEKIALWVDLFFMSKEQKIIDPGVFYALVYLSYRNPQIKNRMNQMYRVYFDALINAITPKNETGKNRTHDTELIGYIIIIITEGLDYSRSVYPNPEKLEKAGVVLKRMVSHFLIHGVD